MTFNNLVHQTSDWLKGNGPFSEVVMSSRVRLARNINKIPFSEKADSTALKKVVSLVNGAVKNSNYLKSALIINLNEISPLDCQFLVERHLISPEIAKGGVGREIVIGDKEILSIMVNEEDHLRFQALQSGLKLLEAWRLVNSVDNEFETALNYAFLPDLGYLTACPTNTGTGMRASVMVHLPALVMTRQINKILTAISKLGLAIRGLYGEGTESRGNFFQISNQVTLGQSEEEIIDNIEKVTKQIISHEQNAKEILLKQMKPQIEDKVWRAYGILKNVRMIDSQEAIKLLSSLRLGIDLRLIKEVSLETLNELLIKIRPAHLQKIEGKKLTANGRDRQRATLIREKLGEEVSKK